MGAAPCFQGGRVSDDHHSFDVFRPVVLAFRSHELCVPFVRQKTLSTAVKASTGCTPIIGPRVLSRFHAFWGIRIPCFKRRPTTF